MFLFFYIATSQALKIYCQLGGRSYARCSSAMSGYGYGAVNGKG